MTELQEQETHKEKSNYEINHFTFHTLKTSLRKDGKGAVSSDKAKITSVKFWFSFQEKRKLLATSCILVVSHHIQFGVFDNQG